MKIFPTPTFMEQVFIRNRHFLPHFFLKILDVLTILWTFYMVTSIKFLKIWNLQDLSFHLTPCLLSLTKIENWPKIWKWNAKAIKHKCTQGDCQVNLLLTCIHLTIFYWRRKICLQLSKKSWIKILLSSPIFFF